MVSKKDKDAEAGLQVLSILTFVWTLGFIYLTRNGDFLGIGMGQFLLACCNSINFILAFILLASWRYTVRENKVKDYLDEHFLIHNSISLKYLIEEFKLSNSAAYKALSIWIIESKVKGAYDPLTGVYTKSLVDANSSGKIDIESDDESEILPFCPKCGKKITILGPDGIPYCDDCEAMIEEPEEQEEDI